MTDEFTNLLCETIGETQKKGHTLESGHIVVNDELWSYKFKKLKNNAWNLTER